MDTRPGSLLVSIIIPTYNGRRWIAGAIDCALAQTHAPCEVVVIDDGSTDGTREYLRSTYGGRIKYDYKSNSGPASSRNRGLSLATGDFIQFLDSDDFLTSDKIEKQVAVFQNTPKCDVVYSDFAFTLADSKGIVQGSPEEFRKKYGAENIFEALLDGNFIVIHAPLTRAHVIKNCGGFDESLSSDEDYDLWLKIAGKEHRFCFIPEVLAFYHKRNSSVSTNLFKQSSGTLQALNKAKKYRAKLTPKERQNLRRNLSREYGWTSHHYLTQGRYSMAVKSAMQSIANAPGQGLVVAFNLLKHVVMGPINRHVLWRIKR